RPCSLAPPLRRPPHSPPFPSTTLFRSAQPLGRRLGFVARHPFQRAGEHHGLARHGRIALRFFGVENRDFLLQALDDAAVMALARSEEHTSELQSRVDLVCRLLLETKKH